MRRVAARVAVVLVLAGIVLVAARPTPREDRTPGIAVTHAAAPLAHSNSRDGRAILSVANMRPGDSRTGEVTIRNRGAAQSLSLATRVRGPLATRLRLTIAGVWDGPLAAVPACAAAGALPRDGARTFRFAVSFRPGRDDDAAMGQSARADFEWRDRCGPSAETRPAPAPVRAAPEPRGALALGDLRLAIGRGPYRFSGRSGTARVGVRCVESDSGDCRGRLVLERWRDGQGRGIALAAGRFTVPAGGARTIALRLNTRARRRILSKRAIGVRAFVTATDASGTTRRVAFRSRLLYRGAQR